MSKKNYIVYPIAKEDRKKIEIGCQIPKENQSQFWFLIDQISEQVIRYGGKSIDQAGISAPWIVLDEYFQQNDYYMFQFLMIQVIDGLAVQTKFSASAKATEDKFLAVCTNFSTITGELTPLKDLQLSIFVSPQQKQKNEKETRYLAKRVEVNHQLKSYDMGITLGNLYSDQIVWHALPREKWDTNLKNAEDYLHAYVLTHTYPSQK